MGIELATGGASLLVRRALIVRRFRVAFSPCLPSRGGIWECRGGLGVGFRVLEGGGVGTLEVRLWRLKSGLEAWLLP